jgi:uncharacterized protein YecE (DUF72 family)
VTATAPSVTGLHVGTSGFSYPSWRGGFYPADAAPEDFLRLYAERLPSVEVNSTFYRLPSEEQLRRWVDATPPGFRFGVKMPRAITFGGRIDGVATFCERVRTLGERLGPVLVRLPDDRPRDEGFLQLLAGSLDPGLRYALDLRHPSWSGVDVAPAVRVNALDDAVAPFRYLRLREETYPEEALAEWAVRVRTLLDEGVDVYAYFRHEDEPTAPQYAARLAELVAAG